MQIDIGEELHKRISVACKKHGSNEVGGILFGEHIGADHFRIVDLTVDSPGFIATFKRSLQHALNSCKVFFGKTNHDYSHFNYLGEWHSHPNYEVYPSGRDDASMLDIVCDPTVGANFVVLMIVRLDANNLKLGAWSYFPNEPRLEAIVNLTQ